MAKRNLPEDFSRQDELKPGSERSFGLVFAGVLALIGLWSIYAGWAHGWTWIGIAGAFALAALAAHKLLYWPNRLWFKLGLLLAAVVSPVALAVVYYGSVVPIGLLMKLLGKDPLRQQRDSKTDSYWISRNPPGPDPQSYKDQF